MRDLYGELGWVEREMMTDELPGLCWSLGEMMWGEWKAIDLRYQ